MSELTVKCPCPAARFETVHEYLEPPAGETRFPLTGAPYRRSLRRCAACGHFVNVHAMDLGAIYEGTYGWATYGLDGMAREFDRIASLDPERSDNAGRVRRILDFAALHFGSPAPRSILDVGSGLCIFLHRMKQAGWSCTALDPDERAVRHAREKAGVSALRGSFPGRHGLGRFDVVAFNKVLEHVPAPEAMLAAAVGHLVPGGFAYVELPDGEAAWAGGGPGREEFFLEHYHAFSPASIARLAGRAGFSPLTVERLREPSGKYTLRMFAQPCPQGGSS